MMNKSEIEFVFTFGNNDNSKAAFLSIFQFRIPEELKTNFFQYFCSSQYLAYNICIHEI